MKIYIIEDILKILKKTLNLSFTLRMKGRKRLGMPLWNLKTCVPDLGKRACNMKLNQETLKKKISLLN